MFEGIEVNLNASLLPLKLKDEGEEERHIDVINRNTQTNELATLKWMCAMSLYKRVSRSVLSWVFRSFLGPVIRKRGRLSQTERPYPAVAALALTVAALLTAPHSTATARSVTVLPTEVLQELKAARVPADALSVWVQPITPSSGKLRAPRWSLQPDAQRNPASLMKLVITYAALSSLGPDHVWLNRVYADGPVREGVLQGNLVLRGSGDPKLVIERLQELWQQVQAAGVREVRGDIVLDAQVFDLPPSTPAQFDDEPLRPYNVAPDGLLLNFKSVLFKFVPDAATGRVQVLAEPALADWAVPAEVMAHARACGDWRSQLKADYSDPAKVRFAGAYGLQCGEQTWPVAFAKPEQYAQRLVQASWLASGGRLQGQVRTGATPATATLLVQAPSLPLSAQIADINKFSNNVMAQQLFLTLSAVLGSPGRWEASRLWLSRWWRDTFAGLAAPVLDNGSGLSRQERISARALAVLLQHAAQSPHAEVFQNSLGVAGIDGTVARLAVRNPKSPAIGQAWLKTGTLKDVTSLAGYVQGQSGERYVFVAIINHPQAQAARMALYRLLEATVLDRR